MDLQWRAARKREWIEFGRSEGLTLREVAARAGVSARTVSRWNVDVREEDRARARALEVTSTPEVETIPQRPDEDPPEPGNTFAEVVEGTGASQGQVQIELPGGGRVVLTGPFDVQTLTRVVEAVKAC